MNGIDQCLSLCLTGSEVRGESAGEAEEHAPVLLEACLVGGGRGPFGAVPVRVRVFFWAKATGSVPPQLRGDSVGEGAVRGCGAVGDEPGSRVLVGLLPSGATEARRKPASACRAGAPPVVGGDGGASTAGANETVCVR